MGEKMKFKLEKVVVENNGTYSAAFTVESWSSFYGAKFPTMNNGAIGIEFSIDHGSNYDPILDPLDGADAVLCASGADPGWVDFSDWVRFVPDNSEYKLRFTCVSQTSGAVTVKVLKRGS